MEEIKTIVEEVENGANAINAEAESEVEAQGAKIWLRCGACDGRMWVRPPITNGTRVRCPHCNIWTTYKSRY